MEKAYEVTQDLLGNAISGASVSVYNADTGALATVYEDNEITVKAQPFLSDSKGGITFKAANGNYRIAATSGGETVNIYRSLFDQDDTPFGQIVLGVTALRGTTPVAKRVWLAYHTITGDGGHGMFRGVTGAAPGTYVDNGGTIIMPTGGDGSAAWLRDYSGAVNVKWFGAKGDGTADDTVAVQAAIDAAVLRGFTGIYAPGGVYKLTGPISKAITGINSFALYGDGADVTEFRFIGAANGFSFTAASGNWWSTVDNGTGMFFRGFSVSTNNINTGIGFAINGGAVAGRPPKKFLFDDVVFRGHSQSDHSWNTHTQLTDCAGIWFNHCRWFMGGFGNTTAIGVHLIGTTISQPSEYHFIHCEAVYGQAWIVAGEYIEGIYLTQCLHVGGLRALYWAATAESGLHVIGGHYNSNGDSNFSLSGIFDFEIMGALLFCNSHGTSAFNHISINNGGRWTICGNTFVGENTGAEIGVFVDNVPSGAQFGGSIVGNTFSNMSSAGVSLGVNSHRIKVDNEYHGCLFNVINNGTDNYVCKRQFSYSVTKTLTGGAPTEVVDFAIPSGIFGAKPSAAFVMSSGTTELIGWYDWDSASSTATNVRCHIATRSGGNITGAVYRFSVCAFE